MIETSNDISDVDFIISSHTFFLFCFIIIHIAFLMLVVPGIIFQI